MKHYSIILVALLTSCFLFACTQKEEEHKDITIDSISINQPTAELTVGETLQLKVFISPSNASNAEVSWSSSRQAVATVSNDGLVVAVAEGSTTIYVIAGGKRDQCEVTVVGKNSGNGNSGSGEDLGPITLSVSSATIMVGESLSLTVNNLQGRSISWSSSKTDVATVSDGNVEGKSVGTSTIIAKVGQYEASCLITVESNVPPVEAISLYPSSLSLDKGQSATIYATITPSNAGKPEDIAWTSSNESVAKVQNGVVSANAAGNSVITASLKGLSASCNVTVKNVIVASSAIDLGLSVKWASCNIGATSPEEFGNYYAWGEIEPKENYTWNTYKWYDSSQFKITKYFYTDDVLETTDDVACVKLGGSWRMPTYWEMKELVDNCDKAFAERNGVAGVTMTSKINGNSIFFPFAGSINGKTLTYYGEYPGLYETWIGFYWTSSFWYDSPSNSSSASDLYLVYYSNSENVPPTVYIIGMDRYLGNPVRPVYPK